jgi:hypothetical protein
MWRSKRCLVGVQMTTVGTVVTHCFSYWHTLSIWGVVWDVELRIWLASSI